MNLNVIIYTSGADPRGLKLLASVFAQLGPGDRILVWDDCSPKPTWSDLPFGALALEIASEFPDVRFDFIQSPLGVSLARHQNLALEEIQDGWIIELDQDEQIQKTFIAEIMSAINDCDDDTVHVFALQRANVIVETIPDQMPFEPSNANYAQYIRWPDWQVRVHHRSMQFTRIYNWHTHLDTRQYLYTPITSPGTTLLHPKTCSNGHETLISLGKKFTRSSLEWQAVLNRTWGVPAHLENLDLCIDGGAREGLNAWLLTVSGCHRIDCYEALPDRFQRLLANLDPDLLGAGIRAYNEDIGAARLYNPTPAGFDQMARPSVSLATVLNRAGPGPIRWMHLHLHVGSQLDALNVVDLSRVQTLCLSFAPGLETWIPKCLPQSHQFDPPSQFVGMSIYVGERITSSPSVLPDQTSPDQAKPQAESDYEPPTGTSAS